MVNFFGIIDSNDGDLIAAAIRFVMNPCLGYDHNRTQCTTTIGIKMGSKNGTDSSMKK